MLSDPEGPWSWFLREILVSCSLLRVVYTVSGSFEQHRQTGALGISWQFTCRLMPHLCNFGCRCFFVSSSAKPKLC